VVGLIFLVGVCENSEASEVYDAEVKLRLQPGLGRFGEMRNIAWLIAPRPMLVEAGSRDPIFPVKAVKQGVKRARTVYHVFDAENKLESDYFEGKHQISGKGAYDFLMENLY